MAERDFYGTKRVTAWREDKTEVSPDDSVYTKEGYAVRYADGHTSWSTKGAFEAAYKPITAMDFSGALAAMKAGHKVCRRAPAWAEGAVVRVASGNDDDPGLWLVFEGMDIDDADLQTGDLLAEDWMIVE